MFCSQCGKNISHLVEIYGRGSVKWCIFCGAPVEGSSPPHASASDSHSRPKALSDPPAHSSSPAVSQLLATSLSHPSRASSSHSLREEPELADDETKESPRDAEATPTALSESPAQMVESGTCGQRCPCGRDREYSRRGVQWMYLLHVSEFQARFSADLYPKLLASPSDSMRKIRKDIKRTFPTWQFFKQDRHRQALENILRAYSVYDHDVGYSQGMAFLAGYLLLHMHEKDAFFSFVKIMYSESHNMRALFDGHSDAMSRCLREFDNLIERRLPELWAHLSSFHVDASMFATQWLLTVFVYRFPKAILPRIWDRFILDGTVVVYQIGLAMLRYLQLQLLSMDEEGVLTCFSSLKFGPMLDDVTVIPFFDEQEYGIVNSDVVHQSRLIRLQPGEFKHIAGLFSWTLHEPDGPAAPIDHQYADMAGQRLRPGSPNERLRRPSLAEGARSQLTGSAGSLQPATDRRPSL